MAKQYQIQKSEVNNDSSNIDVTGALTTPTTLEDELNVLRSIIRRLIGLANHYDAPSRDVESLHTALSTIETTSSSLVTDVATNTAAIATNVAAIATNLANITSNDADIAANLASIATNATNIATNATDIATNATNIATNATGIATNTTNIATNAANVATNTTNIATNATDIATNTTNIATNATDIATNTTNVATNTTDIATNTTDIATNTTAIATNTTNIATNTSDIAALTASDIAFNNADPALDRSYSASDAQAALVELDDNMAYHVKGANADFVVGTPEYPTIQSAIDGARKYRVDENFFIRIRIPNGTYAITTPLTIRHPQAHRVIIHPETGGKTYTKGSITGTKATDEANVRAGYDVVFDCTTNAFTQSDLRQSSGATIENIAMIGSGTGEGIDLDNQQRMRIAGCVLMNFNRGVRVRNRAYVDASDTCFMHNNFPGVFMQTAAGFYSLGCAHSYNGQQGISTESQCAVYCLNGDIEGNTLQGLYLTQGTNGYVENTNFTNNSGTSVDMLFSSGVNVRFCTFNEASGVLVSGLFSCSFRLTNNTISGASTLIQALYGTHGQVVGAHTGATYSPAKGVAGNIHSFIL